MRRGFPVLLILSAAPAWAAENPLLTQARALQARLQSYWAQVPHGPALIAGAIVLALVIVLIKTLLTRRPVPPANPPSAYSHTDYVDPSGQRTPPAAAVRGRQQLNLTQADLDSFTALALELNEIWRAQDTAGLSRVATPEMAGKLAQRLQTQIEQNKGWTVHELQVIRSDLTEAWREGTLDHAQVNMRLSTLESAASETPRRFVSRELWSFERPRGEPWRIAGVHSVE